MSYVKRVDDLTLQIISPLQPLMADDGINLHGNPNRPRRNWMFTYNNPGERELDYDFAEEGSHVRYAIWQREIAPSTGTPHFQGYVEFDDNVRITHCRKILPGAHWEHRRGSRKQAIAYCSKDDTRAEGEGAGPFEYGTRESGGQGARNDLLEAKTLIDSGATEAQVADDHFASWCRNYRAFERYRRLKGEQRDWPVDVHVLYGPPGTGKSRYAMATYPGAYWKPRGEWWDGYEGQKVVVLDEFFGWLPWDTLLKICDRYPLLLETKGGTVNCLVDTVVITTNKPPPSWYGPKCPFDAFERRVSVWHHFPTVGVHNQHLSWGIIVAREYGPDHPTV